MASLLEEKKKRSIHLQYMCQSPVLVEFKMLLSQKVSLFQNVERREKTFPLKYFLIWKQQPTDLLLAHLPADTPHSAKGDRPKPESSTDSKGKCCLCKA